MSSKFYVDKVLYNDYEGIVQNIIEKENLKLQLYLLHHNCISFPDNTKKIIMPFYYLKMCFNNNNNFKIKNIKRLTNVDKTFFLISFNNTVDNYYYLNNFCNTYYLLTMKQRLNAKKCTRYENLLMNLNNNKNSGGYVIKSFYDSLPTAVKSKLHIISVKQGKYPLLVTLE